MDTFQFTGHCGNFVYLNFNLVVYSAPDPSSQFIVNRFIDFPRRRRAMEEEEGVARAVLTRGPSIFRSDEAVARNFYTTKTIHD